MIRERHDTVTYNEDIMRSQGFLYKNFFGRILLKLLIRPFISKIVGKYQNSKRSIKKIKPFIEKNKIEMSDYLEEEYTSFNHFFTRKIKEENRPFSKEKIHFISPCDAKLLVQQVNEDAVFKIKDAYYSLSTLLKNDKVAQEYKNGQILIFRLATTDYHRYCYVDNGFQEKITSIPGVLHTVNPIALEKYNFFATNHREYASFKSENFGKLLYISVGAMMVGKIQNFYTEYQAKRGEEMGMFLFGGSTVCLLVKENIIQIDQDILDNSKENIETIVKYRSTIGMKR